MYKYRFKREAINFENLIKLKSESIAKLFEYFNWILKEII